MTKSNYYSMTWHYTFTDVKTRYGTLKRGKRVVAAGVTERDGKKICRAVNRYRER